MIQRFLFIFGLILGLITILLSISRQEPITDSVSFAFFRTDMRGNQILRHINLAGQQNLLMQTSIDRPIINFDWNQDGQWLLVTVSNWEEGSGDVYLVSADGQTQQHIYHTPFMAIGAQYSPDKSKIALIRRGDANDFQWGYLIILDAQGIEISRYRIGVDFGSDRYWEMMWLDDETIQVSTRPFIDAYEIDLTAPIATPIEPDAVILPRNRNDSPDGKWTLDTDHDASNMGLLRIAREPETEPMTIHEFEGITMQYTWSADSQWVLVNVHGPPLPTGYGGLGKFFMVDVDGEDVRYLLDDSYLKGWLPFAYSIYASDLQHISYPFSINNEWLAFIEYEDTGVPANADVIDARLHVINTLNPDYQIKNLTAGKILHAHINWAPVPKQVDKQLYLHLALSLIFMCGSLSWHFRQKR